MSTPSLFDAEPKRSGNAKAFLIAVVVFVAVFGTAAGLYFFSKPKAKTDAERLAEEVRDSTVMMLAQPTFSGDEFASQVLGKGKFERLDWKTKEAYFTFPKTDQGEFEEFLTTFFSDQKKIEFAVEQNGKLALGKYQMTAGPESPHFFKTEMSNFRADPAKTLNFKFTNVDYTLSLAEMRDFTNNSQVYGGKLLAGTERRAEQTTIVFANHAIMVARPEEPSLKRLAAAIIGDATEREQKIQRLTDFVSREIEYSYTEAVGASETLKRAPETLMTRTADCSNKTILLASLLEQIEEEYILLYCPQHITVAVPQGNFVNQNKIDFVWNGKPWLIAETTLPGFQIGLTNVKEFARLTKIEYVQSPRQSDIIFDANSYAVLKFY
ncbi:MAG: transglutaminase domain-containing protein [Acidobacteria bacterium]|nr:transglutaminase domain-containing protein [Acidobacteriota bacterium]